MHAIGIEQFVESDEVTMEAVSAGKALVALERNKKTRQLEKERKAEGNSRLGGGASSLAGRLRGVSNRGFSSATSIERQPIIEEGESEWGDLEARSREASSITSFHKSRQQQHPAPANFFDDM